MSPLELSLEIRPRARIDIMDVRAKALDIHGDALLAYPRCLYFSPHTTAGYLSQSLAARLAAHPQKIRQYVELFRTMFPEGAGYSHDKLELRDDLNAEQRPLEPTNADSHLAFMGGGLHACVSYLTSRPGPVYFIDLDGVHATVPRRRATTLIGYEREVEVARTSLRVPVSAHSIDAVNLKDPRLGLYEQLGDLIRTHGVTKGRVRLQLGAGEQYASLTVNEYETLLMQHDLAEVLRNPMRFALEKARHAWDDPRALPVKAIDYAKYDLVRTLNRIVDALGFRASRLERMLARVVAVPAARFLRMKRGVDLLVSDSVVPGTGAVVDGTYQAPIMVQWRRAGEDVRVVDVSLMRFH